MKTSISLPTSPKIGIIGGGQLSLMLASAARRMGFNVFIFTENADAPAAQVFTQTIFGSPHDENALRWFFSQIDLAIFENEFVDCALLEKAAQGTSLKFVPSLKTITQLQDKLNQKRILKELEIPSSDFREIKLNDLKSKIPSQIQDCLKEFGGRCVLKWARMGYDGKGVLVVSSTQDPSVQDLKISSFIEEARKRKSPLYAEAFVPFKRELAMISSYSIKDEWVSYPLVISEQRDGICYRVYGPATGLGVSPTLEKKASLYAKKLAKALQLYGSFALEFFETQEGELLINEIAPRVHNSGHYTQNACATDQFENHVRAVLGWELGEPQPCPGFGMFNLLGPQDLRAQTKKPILSKDGFLLPIVSPRTHLHWYGKKEILPGRKLGHLNATLSCISDSHLDALLKEFHQVEQQWISMNQQVNSKGLKIQD